MQLLIFASFSEPHLGGKVQSDPHPTPSFLGCRPAAIPTASDFAILVLHLIEVNNLSLSLPQFFLSLSRRERGQTDGRGGHCTLPSHFALSLSPHRRVAASAARHAHRRSAPSLPRPARAKPEAVRGLRSTALPTTVLPFLTVNQTKSRLNSVSKTAS